MNKLDNMDQYSVKPETFLYGLSTLHAYIRFLECILYISYRLDFKTWYKNLIQRFGNILSAMSSGHEVNVPEFKFYTTDTAKLFISLYPWFYMPSSVHKILIHGANVINAALLPIGKI